MSIFFFKSMVRKRIRSGRAAILRALKPSIKNKPPSLQHNPLTCDDYNDNDNGGGPAVALPASCNHGVLNNNRGEGEGEPDISAVIPVERDGDTLPSSVATAFASVDVGKLDTRIVHDYMEMLWKGLSSDKQECCAFIDCVWFYKYIDATLRNLEAAQSLEVCKWVKDKQILAKPYVFIPVVYWGHWNLLVLCHLGRHLGSDVKEQCILLLDSLRTIGLRHLDKIIRRFLIDVYKEEGMENCEDVVRNIPFIIPEITKNWFQHDEIETRRKHIYELFLINNDRRSKRYTTRPKQSSGFLGVDKKIKFIDLSESAEVC